jgi:hypothetical protein
VYSQIFDISGLLIGEDTYEWSRLTALAFKSLLRWGFKLTLRNIRSEAYATTHLQAAKTAC